MTAFPEDIIFNWSFKKADNTWNPINTSGEGYNITNIGLTSYLFVAKFQPDQAGHYKVYGNNSVKPGRDYIFELRSHSKYLIVTFVKGHH